VTGKRLHVFDCPDARLVRVRFSPDGRRFATAGSNGLITLWDAVTRLPMPIGRGYRSELHDVVFSPDGRRLITTGTSPKDLVKLWDVETGRDVATMPGEPGLYFLHIGFSPDGKTLFAVASEGTALFWRAPSWEEIEAAENRKHGP
jgi:WD40 repeat protein